MAFSFFGGAVLMSLINQSNRKHEAKRRAKYDQNAILQENQRISDQQKATLAALRAEQNKAEEKVRKEAAEAENAQLKEFKLRKNQLEQEQRKLEQLFAAEAAEIEFDLDLEEAALLACAYGKDNFLKSLNHYLFDLAPMPVQNPKVDLNAAEPPKKLQDERIKAFRYNFLALHPLHIAAEANQLDILKLLIDQGIDLQDRNHQHYTALEIAKKHKHLEATQLLQAALKNKHDLEKRKPLKLNEANNPIKALPQIPPLPPKETLIKEIQLLKQLAQNGPKYTTQENAFERFSAQKKDIQINLLKGKEEVEKQTLKIKADIAEQEKAYLKTIDNIKAWLKTCLDHIQKNLSALQQESIKLQKDQEAWTQNIKNQFEKHQKQLKKITPLDFVQGLYISLDGNLGEKPNFEHLNLDVIGPGNLKIPIAPLLKAPLFIGQDNPIPSPYDQENKEKQQKLEQIDRGLALAQGLIPKRTLVKPTIPLLDPVSAKEEFELFINPEGEGPDLFMSPKWTERIFEDLFIQDEEQEEKELSQLLDSMVKQWSVRFPKKQSLESIGPTDSTGFTGFTKQLTLGDLKKLNAKNKETSKELILSKNPIETIKEAIRPQPFRERFSLPSVLPETGPNAFLEAAYRVGRAIERVRDTVTDPIVHPVENLKEITQLAWDLSGAASHAVLGQCTPESYARNLQRMEGLQGLYENFRTGDILTQLEIFTEVTTSLILGGAVGGLATKLPRLTAQGLTQLETHLPFLQKLDGSQFLFKTNPLNKTIHQITQPQIPPTPLLSKKGKLVLTGTALATTSGLVLAETFELGDPNNLSSRTLQALTLIGAGWMMANHMRPKGPTPPKPKFTNQGFEAMYAADKALNPTPGIIFTTLEEGGTPKDFLNLYGMLRRKHTDKPPKHGGLPQHPPRIPEKVITPIPGSNIVIYNGQQYTMRPGTEGLVFKDAPYHTKKGNALKSKAPENGRLALYNSEVIGPNSPNRIGIDPVNGEIVSLHSTGNNVFHGHVRSWQQLHPSQKNALIKHFDFNAKGKLLNALRRK